MCDKCLQMRSLQAQWKTTSPLHRRRLVIQARRIYRVLEESPPLGQVALWLEQIGRISRMLHGLDPMTCPETWS